LGGHFPILKFDLRGRILGRFPHQAYWLEDQSSVICPWAYSCLVFESCLTKNVTDIIVNERRPAGHNWTEESCYLYLPCMYFPHTHALSPLFCHLRFRFQDLSYISPAFDWSLCFWFYSNILCFFCPLFLCLLSTFIREGGLVWVGAPLDDWFLLPLLWVFWRVLVFDYFKYRKINVMLF